MRHPAVFLKAQLVLFLPKASPYAHVALKIRHVSLKNMQFALIDFSETFSTIPCIAGSARAPPSSLNDPRGGCPPYLPPYVLLVIPCRPGALFGLISLLSGLQEVHKKVIFPKQANNDLKMTNNGFL